MKRVVITGIGIISSIGNNKEEVLKSLIGAKSGIKFNEEFAKYGLRSTISGQINVEFNDYIPKKNLKYTGEAGAYAHIAMKEALADSKLTKQEYSNTQAGVVAGSGGASSEDQVLCADVLRQKGIKKVSPYTITRIMGSSISAALATDYNIKGISYSINSACSTSAHCIGHGYELIKQGKNKIIFAGGAEAIHWTLAAGFDAMKALSSRSNDAPELASCPYSKDRDGFVASGGGGIIVLEEYEHAKSRNAKIYGEVTGYHANSDGNNMVLPSGEGAERCMIEALKENKKPVDYINTHGTSTVMGDVIELKAIKNIFNEEIPPISSTKAISGHALGASGVHEIIYSTLMMQNNFICPSANIRSIDEEAKNFPIITEHNYQKNINSFMSNSFGFGGTNACVIVNKLKT